MVFCCCLLVWYNCHSWLGITNRLSVYIMVGWALQISYRSISWLTECYTSVICLYHGWLDITNQLPLCIMVNWALQICYLSVPWLTVHYKSVTCWYDGCVAVLWAWRSWQQALVEGHCKWFCHSCCQPRQHWTSPPTRTCCSLPGTSLLVSHPV